MTWRALLHLPPGALAAADAAVEMAFGEDDAPCVSMFEEEDGRRWLVSLDFTTPPDANGVERFRRLLVDRGAAPEAPITVEQVEQRDWVSASQRLLSPVTAGRFFVHGGHDAHRRRPYGVNLRVEAGQAFGSGHHATTRGCLLMLDRLARRMPPQRRPRRCLDLGCGSGVLAMAMARQFRRRVLASDIDPVAERVTRANARVNALPLYQRYLNTSWGVVPLTAVGLHHRALRAGMPYDLLAANILAGPLVAMAGEIAQALAPGGWLILAGLMTHQERRVIAAYRARGVRPVARLESGGWPTLLLRRPQLSAARPPQRGFQP